MIQKCTLKLHLNRLEEESKQRQVSPLEFAATYANLGDKDRAIQFLEEYYGAGDRRSVYFKVDPRWDPLRSDPRFQDLLRRMNLPE